MISPEERQDLLISFAMHVARLSEKHGFVMPDPRHVRKAFENDTTLDELDARMDWTQLLREFLKRQAAS